ncbi:hypothetical protein VSS74_13115 [Conexibacter stalactiti]|uniref:Uncharacterized protein n=1 Tax=Conexibacter stalactiti TaxID=1940611 RepID=A0ABU4HPN4_9ACTN|nr:hypothetical protein [Conexibacter stalactiti]MDW5595283.1 hypothetical protein [Conexibacter stalactiti]MEC5035925.1 hypothetical protein [Conexibacter stalactiti]
MLDPPLRRPLRRRDRESRTARIPAHRLDRDFAPDGDLRDFLLSSVESATAPGADAKRRRDPTTQLERLQDIYVMGDMTRAQYVMRRQAIEQELERVAPPVDPQLDKAAAILADFGTFRELESSPAERRKLLTSLFEGVWEQNGAITAVKPRAAFDAPKNDETPHNGGASESP